MPETASKTDKTREGLLLCMMLAASMDETPYPEELREISHIAGEEPDFAKLTADEFDNLLKRVQKDLHRKPDEIMKTIARLLDDEDSRRRGLELATRVITADGIVNPDHAALLRNLVRQLDLSQQDLDACVLAAQKRLVRFMMVYLVYLAASSDGRLNPVEFEEMIPLILALPAFKGVTKDQFAFITQSVRSHLDLMKGEWGLDYIAGTLINAARLLNDNTIPEQACRLVARGVFADGVVTERERDFFHSIANRFNLPRNKSEDMISVAVHESRERVKKLPQER